jgi:hypothetical protein
MYLIIEKELSINNSTDLDSSSCGYFGMIGVSEQYLDHPCRGFFKVVGDTEGQ